MGSFNNSPLPDALSQSLQLDHPTDRENKAIWTLTSNSWKDALPVDIYLKEQQHLMTVPLAKDGGITQWVLVDNNDPVDQRLLLASCETFRKRSWISDPDGNVSEVITHGVASVYSNPKYRGRGYASRLMRELGEVLPTWQTESASCAASVLFSDIGKRFYAKLGWHAFPSYHLEFAPSAGLSSPATPIYAEDLKQLCDEDEALARKAMGTPCPAGKTRFMIVPDHELMLWHHSKEEFAGDTLFRKHPQFKGAITGEPGNRVWAVWTHRFYEPPSQTASNDNTLYILRLVIENQAALDSILSESPTAKQHNDFQVKGVQAVILAAQAEASEWGLHSVKLWGPSTQVQEMIKRTGISYRGEDRDEDGICCLRWYGEGHGEEEVEWIGNEKYGWC